MVMTMILGISIYWKRSVGEKQKPETKESVSRFAKLIDKGLSNDIVSNNKDYSFIDLKNKLLFGLVDGEATVSEDIEEEVVSVAVVGSTGAEQVEFSESEILIMETRASLRDRLPIFEDGFSIDYDYKINRFIVWIDWRKISDLEIFYRWVDNNGYELIDKSRFVTKNSN